ncbi:MAG TPA: oxidoreductase [Ohtaekwangia sp.]|uniref:oxidoreductase n=1 Tax=Ohtaekwangia sp. TaxID=2066019 RepID=UPI002F95EEF6
MQTLQQPIHSGFTAASTAEDVIKGKDLKGKVAIVTGGYAGIGLETTRVLHAAGATVIVPARDITKAKQALAGLNSVKIEPMDLIDPASVDNFVKKFVASGRPLHILVNNAGVMANPLTRDARGYESQFATNHLGHFQLTVGLWAALRQAKGARVVALSSWGHRYSPVIFDDIHFNKREYDRWLAYGQSKTANVLFALALDARSKEHNIRAFSVHPGTIVSTDLSRYIEEEELRKFGVLDEQGNPVIDPSRQFKTIPQGAATSVWCATSAILHDIGGVYCENCDISPVKQEVNNDMNELAMRGVLQYAIDPESAERLWTVSEELTGVKLKV